MQVKSLKCGNLIRFLLAAALLFCAVFAMFACEEDTFGAVKIVSITPYADTFKQSYHVGDSFADGAQFLVEYKDGHGALVDISEMEVSGFTSAKAGEISLSLTYGGKTVRFPIRIVALTATELALREGTLPSVLYRGMALPSTGKLDYTLVNGASGTVDVKSDMVMGYEPLVVGKQMLTINYLGKTVHHLITVENDFVKSISLSDYHSEYNVGDAFITSGAKLFLHYASGTTATKQLTAAMVSGFSTASGGLHTFTVTDMGCSCDCQYFVNATPTEATFDVTVADRYEKGDAFATNYLMSVVFDDGSEGNVPVTTQMLSGFDTSVSGTYTAVISYYQFTFYYPYVVLSDAVSLTFYNYTTCVRQGAVFDGIGNLTVYMQDGSQENVLLDDVGVQMSGYDTENVGTITAKFTYRKCEACFNVEVYNPADEYMVQSIIFNGTLGNVLSGEDISTEGLSILVNYKYLKSATVQVKSAMLSDTSFVLDEGDSAEKTVTVTYRNASTEVGVRVLSKQYAATVTALHILSVPTLVAVGDDLDLSAANMVAIYGGGYRSEVVNITDAMLYGYDLTQSGLQTVTVSYGGMSAQYALTVIDESEKTTVTAISLQGFAPLVFAGDTVSDIDLSGATLLVTYGGGYSTDRLPVSADMLCGDFTASGNAEVTCTYAGKNATILIYVYEKSLQTVLTSIACKSALDGIVGEAPSFASCTLVLTFGYGYSTSEIPLDGEGVQLGNYDISVAGTQYVDVAYGGVSCYLTLRLSSAAGDVVTGIEVASSSCKNFAVGAAFGGITILINKTFTLSELSVTEDMVSGFDTSTVGQKTLIVNYGGYTAEWDYEVTD